MSGPMVDMGLLQEIRTLQKRVADLEQQRPPLYQRGTWTPTAIGGTSAGTTTYSLQTGLWTRSGRILVAQGRVTWTAATGTGSLILGGLPQASNTTANLLGAAALRVTGIGSGGAPVEAYVSPGQSALTVGTLVAGVFTPLTLPASGDITITLTYHL